jgi:hypothetical protein
LEAFNSASTLEFKKEDVMKRLLMAATKAVVIALALTALSIQAPAQTLAAPGESQKIQDGPAALPKLSLAPPAAQENATAAHALKGTYFNSGNWGGTFFPGNSDYSVDNQLTVDCPGTTTCTIEADMWVEEGWAPSASTGGLCLDLDNGGQFYCWDSHYIDELYPNVGSFSQIYSFTGVEPGKHTVQTFLYSGTGTDVWEYYITYHVYTP